MIFRQAIFLIPILIAMKARGLEACERSCKSGGRSEPEVVPFPFGFSDGCEIRLNCSDSGGIRIGEFGLGNITSRGAFVSLPAKCNRSIGSIQPLFGKNYGPSSETSFLLRECTPKLDACDFPVSFVENRLGVRFDCGGSANRSSNDSLSCFSQEAEPGNALDVVDLAALTRSPCKYVYASIAVDSAVSRNAPEFQTVELTWWRNGSCSDRSCHVHATCRNLSLPGEGLGFRCECKLGFSGDGFGAGERGASGCRKARDCNAKKYLLGQCGGANKIGVLIAGIICGAILMSILTFTCHVVRRRSACLKSRMSAKRLLTEAAGNSSVAIYTYKDIEKATHCFSESQRLGTGAFGMVYAGKLNNDELVAIKKIKYRDNNTIDQVMNEIKLLSSVSHPNLVRLLGCCIDQGEQILVYEFMPNGTLSQHLQRERGKGLPWTTRLTVACETANAITYLHTAMNPPIYHRDIKSSNILLDYSFKSKVADFGLSRLGMTEISHISTAPQGTPGYVDPQYHQNFHLSDKSDVYSFGVVLLEIITALKVVDFNRPQSEVNLAALAVDRIGRGCVDEIVDPFLDPNRDAWTLYSVNKVAELAFRCLAFHSDTRPSMIEVADELDQIRRSGWATMEDSVFATSALSASSSPYNGSESMGSSASKKVGLGSQRLLIPQRTTDSLATMEEQEKECSPVSIEDPWFSEQSSPSANSLLGNVVR